MSADATTQSEPDLPFRGILFSPHDEAELARLRASDRCRVTSNEIEILIEGDPLL